MNVVRRTWVRCSAVEGKFAKEVSAPIFTCSQNSSELISIDQFGDGIIWHKLAPSIDIHYYVL